LGRGARAGVLFRNAEAIEALRQVDTLVIDKTGTLTEGRPELVAVEPAPGADEAQLLGLAASLERGSEHPVARAIAAGAATREVALTEPEGFEARPGGGVVGRVAGRQLILGTQRLLQAEGVDTAASEARALELASEGQTIVWAAADGGLLGLLGVSDPIKQTTPEALASLAADGLRIVVLSGDTREAALAVAGKLGLTEVEAPMLPEEKAAAIARLQEQGRVVAMAGDGVNDAPALARADVGIAMGTGTDVAMESAGVTLVGGDLRGIARARRLSRATLTNIRQNLFFAFAYNALGIPIAAGVLVPLLGWRLNPMLAAAAMSLSSISVIANALRLRRVRL
jgi:Cu+-exporting ATPase